MKKLLSHLVYIVVAAQPLWLAWNYHARSEELATSPRIRIAARTYDPRDFARGYYQSLDTSVHLSGSRASTLFGASVNQSQLTERLLNIARGTSEEYTHELAESFSPPTSHSSTAKELPVMLYEEFPLSTFWEKQASGLREIGRIELPDSPEDTVAGEEVRVPMTARWRMSYSTNEETKTTKVTVELLLRFPGLRDLRYYYPEATGDFFTLLRQKEIQSPIAITADLLIRPTAAIIPTQLYLNGIPYNEATELLKQNQFPFRQSATP
ncbi:MAG: hypothetical protein IJ498_05660 [Akkermansia sp.]|nr:hypothetical protein [Akkermansia sp.]